MPALYLEIEGVSKVFHYQFEGLICLKSKTRLTADPMKLQNEPGTRIILFN